MRKGICFPCRCALVPLQPRHSLCGFIIRGQHPKPIYIRQMHAPRLIVQPLLLVYECKCTQLQSFPGMRSPLCPQAMPTCGAWPIVLGGL